MILLITGSTHTGKTWLAHQLMEHWHISVLSQDHLKMGLIRSGQTDLTPMDDDRLTDYLWPITKEIIKTVIENQQDLIVEGCYVPPDWKKDFDEVYLKEIQYACLVMSEKYIRDHETKILEHGNIIEHRLENTIDLEALIAENADNLKICTEHQYPMIWIDKEYDVFEQAKRLFRCVM